MRTDGLCGTHHLSRRASPEMTSDELHIPGDGDRANGGASSTDVSMSRFRREGPFAPEFG